METKKEQKGKREPVFSKIRRAYISISIILFNILLLLLLTELISGFFVKEKDSSRKNQNYKNMKANLYEKYSLVYPGKSKEYIGQILKEKKNKLVYEPWMQFRLEDSQGKHINSSGLIRKSIPAISKKSTEDQFFDIYFFGGSTMYGINIADDETIPSHFVRLFQKRYPNHHPIRVTNYGQPFYYSYQEVMLLFNFILKGKKPDAVIFLDGLNDVLAPSSSYGRYPFWTPKLKALFLYDDLMESLSFSHIISLLFERTNIYKALMGKKKKKLPRKKWNTSYRMPAGVPLDKVADKIVKNYIHTIEIAERLCHAHGIKCAFFWQPVPFYGYDRTRDPIYFQREKPLFGKIYPLIEEKSKQKSNLFFLGNMLNGVTFYPFVDAFHYTSEFSKKIAAIMLEKMNIPRI